MTGGVYEVNFVVEGSSAQRMLEQLDTALNPIALLGFLKGTVGPFLQERAKDRFAQEGDDVSGKWAPLQEPTQEIRSRGDWPVSGDHPINVRTGELEAYITKSNAVVWSHSIGATLRYPGNQTTRKSIVEKMRTAQTGRANPRTVPRPVLGMNEQDLSFVMTALFGYVKKATAV